MKNGQLVVGVLAGLFAGTVLGVLFAPAKGSETRRRILGKRPAEELAEEIILQEYFENNNRQFQFVDDSF
ncbi:MAG: YtxH domain-containing protein [Ferruginibacter sp.]